MAEKIIPFAHTVLLPAGSPAIGCVDAVRLDLSGIKCQYNGGACYCLGDADVPHPRHHRKTAYRQRRTAAQPHILN